MNIEKLIPLAVAFALMAAATGNLPKAIKQIRMAQAHLIQESKASNWGTPFTVRPSSQNKTKRILEQSR
jgi:hypothetical protein